MFSIPLPFFLNIGSLHLSPNRILLLGAFVPAAITVFSGKAGRIRAADVLLGLCSVWVALALFNYEGVNAVQNIGITVVEMYGAYLVARRTIRSEADYLALVRVMRLIAIFLAPAAAIESLTKYRIYNKLFGLMFSTFPWANYEPRWHMFRAQTAFEHPILYGVYVAFMLAPVYTAARMKKGPILSFISALPVLAATFFSLSAGAYLGMFLQIGLMGWGLVMARVPGRWQIFGLLVALAYIVVDTLSNRSPFQVFISYLTFNSSTSYWRVLIFQYGMENVWASPFLGRGLNDWVRPRWMITNSIDNFWLVFAIRYGIPGVGLMFGTYLAVLIGLMRARPASASVKAHRNALVFSLAGIGIAICTVHLWGAVFVFFMFMLGAGAWISEAPRDGAQATPARSPARTAPASAVPQAIMSGRTRSAAAPAPARSA